MRQLFSFQKALIISEQSRLDLARQLLDAQLQERQGARNTLEKQILGFRSQLVHQGAAPEKASQIHAVVATLEEQLASMNAEIDAIRRETANVEATSTAARTQIHGNRDACARQVRGAGLEAQQLAAAAALLRFGADATRTPPGSAQAGPAEPPLREEALAAGFRAVAEGFGALERRLADEGHVVPEGAVVPSVRFSLEGTGGAAGPWARRAEALEEENARLRREAEALRTRVTSVPAPAPAAVADRPASSRIPDHEGEGSGSGSQVLRIDADARPVFTAGGAIPSFPRAHLDDERLLTATPTPQARPADYTAYLVMPPEQIALRVAELEYDNRRLRTELGTVTAEAARVRGFEAAAAERDEVVAKLREIENYDKTRAQLGSDLATARLEQARLQSQVDHLKAQVAGATFGAGRDDRDAAMADLRRQVKEFAMTTQLELEKQLIQARAEFSVASEQLALLQRSLMDSTVTYQREVLRLRGLLQRYEPQSVMPKPGSAGSGAAPPAHRLSAGTEALLRPTGLGLQRSAAGSPSTGPLRAPPPGGMPVDLMFPEYAGEAQEARGVEKAAGSAEGPRAHTQGGAANGMVDAAPPPGPGPGTGPVAANRNPRTSNALPKMPPPGPGPGPVPGQQGGPAGSGGVAQGGGRGSGAPAPVTVQGPQAQSGPGVGLDPRAQQAQAQQAPRLSSNLT